MITADNVTVLFKKNLFKKKIHALDGFNIKINRGDIFGLLGPNGAGKSTAMYCFLGLIKPNKGIIKIFGNHPEPGSILFDKIAYIPEEPHYHLYLTVEEALKYYASLYMTGVKKENFSSILKRIGLYEHRDLQLSKCSKGMKQKLGIACCLVKNVEIVFLDEPTRGLDPIMVKEFRDIILDMNKNGVSFVINSHMLSEIETVCNRVAIINKGKLIVQDELSNLMRTDKEHYNIELKLSDSTIRIPDFVKILNQENDILKCEVNIYHINNFFKFIIETNSILINCSMKKISLEDAFFNILKGK
ncbi:ABC transporter ATP-binding protein [Candidatus Dependentiae bacterium]|nr:ABC transporter ATP-binding protein [Candidatus Dependentiae bacterium]